MNSLWHGDGGNFQHEFPNQSSGGDLGLLSSAAEVFNQGLPEGLLLQIGEVAVERHRPVRHQFKIAYLGGNDNLLRFKIHFFFTVKFKPLDKIGLVFV